MDSDGDTAAIGTDTSGTGGVYIYNESGGTWSEAQKIQSSDIASDDGFGSSLAMSSDGTLLLVGAPREANGGAVYYFALVEGTWTQKQKITGSDTTTGDEFGCSLALDGENLVVGAKSSGTGGQVYIFSREEV